MSDPSGSTRVGAPLPLLVAAALAGLEGLVLLGYGVAELASLNGGRAVMGATTTLFFAAFGGLLLFAAYCLARCFAWARGPVLLAQVIALGLAWNFRHHSTWPVAVALAVGGLVVLGGLLHPRSVAALEGPAGE